MKLLSLILRVLGVATLALVGIAVALLLIRELPWEVAWDVWAILTAVGTVGATLVALTLALRTWANSRTSSARLVSAWITDEFAAKEDGSAYERKARLHIANESNEPVFHATAGVHIGRASTPLGPLSAPSIIAVIPPRRELVFDISVPLLAHPDAWSLKASLAFSDPRGKGWVRDVDGTLSEVSARKRQSWSKTELEPNAQQIGDMETPFNPLSVVVQLLDGLRSPQINNESLVHLFADTAPAWKDVDFDLLTSELERYQPTSMVDFQADRIARVKLSGDESLEGKQVGGIGRRLELQDFMFVTLILHPQRGWQIFQIGEPVPSGLIDFGGTLAESLAPLRSEASLVWGPSPASPPQPYVAPAAPTHAKADADPLAPRP